MGVWRTSGLRGRSSVYGMQIQPLLGSSRNLFHPAHDLSGGNTGSVRCERIDATPTHRKLKSGHCTCSSESHISARCNDGTVYGIYNPLHRENQGYTAGHLSYATGSENWPFAGSASWLYRTYRSEEHTSELQSLRHLVC